MKPFITFAEVYIWALTVSTFLSNWCTFGKANSNTNRMLSTSGQMVKGNHIDSWDENFAEGQQMVIQLPFLRSMGRHSLQTYIIMVDITDSLWIQNHFHYDFQEWRIWQFWSVGTGTLLWTTQAAEFNIIFIRTGGIALCRQMMSCVIWVIMRMFVTRSQRQHITWNVTWSRQEFGDWNQLLLQISSTFTCMSVMLCIHWIALNGVVWPITLNWR